MIAWWRALSPVPRALVLVGAALLAVNVLTGAVGSMLGGGPAGPASSSYATAPEGLSAWATLLDEQGHRVARLRDTVDRVSLDPAATLVIADPGAIQLQEPAPIDRFVRAGGRLVVSGERASVLAATMVRGLQWAPGGPSRASTVPGQDEIGGELLEVSTVGAGHWREVGAARSVVAGDGQSVLAVAEVGAGTVVALADTSPLTNDRLDEAGNAALAIAIAGAPDRPVLFTEAGHGYGADGFGLDDLPDGWATVVIGTGVAAALWLWSRARRFGPPNDADELPPPPRRAYVDALAAMTARAGAPAEAVAPLRGRARRQLARRAAVDERASDDELRRAAGRAGVDEHLVDAVLAVPSSSAAVMELGRAAARLEEGS